MEENSDEESGKSIESIQVENKRRKTDVDDDDEVKDDFVICI